MRKLNDSHQESLATEISTSGPTLQVIKECKDFIRGLVDLDTEPDLDLRRREAVEFICKTLEADFGFWSWGRGHPETDDPVVPIATIPWGLEPNLVQLFFQTGMSEDSERWHRAPFLPLLRLSPQVCRSRASFWTTEEWTSSKFRNSVLETVGLDEWMICVRYPSRTHWSCLSLLRKGGKPCFSDRDCALVDFACATIRWLQSHPPTEERVPSHSGLNPRNREALYLLLDGRSRKEIAAALNVTTHIVNDCIKQIYSHFGATSATELAAIFLRRN